MIGRYVKKPIEIEAVKWEPSSALYAEIRAWTKGAVETTYECVDEPPPDPDDPEPENMADLMEGSRTSVWDGILGVAVVCPICDESVILSWFKS